MPKRGGTKVVLNIRMSRERRALIDAAAQRLQITRSELIAMFIDIGLDSMPDQKLPAPGNNGQGDVVELPGLEVDDTVAQQALEDSVNRAIGEIVQDTNEAELGAELDAGALSDYAPEQPHPHLHTYTMLLGSTVDVGGTPHASYLCGQCGAQKFDVVH